MKIGIDLGTYNSSGAVAFDRDRVVMIGSRHGRTPYGAGKNFPSFVLFDRLGEKQAVGLPAKRQLPDNPELVVWGVKRLVGLSYQAAVQRGELNKFQYAIEQDENGSIFIRVGSRKYRPQDVLSFIFQEIRHDAEDSALNPMTGGRTIEDATITVPAYFKAIRTNSIVEAARMAGFRNIDTIAEPTAAALRYGLKVEKEAMILAFDMGAGTLDVTVMEMIEDAERGGLIPGVLCTSGHEALGGIDIDACLIQYVTQKHGVADDHRSLGLLRDDLERAKCLLSTREQASFSLPNGDLAVLTQTEVESAINDLLQRCRGPIRVALREAKIEADKIDHVVFIGGPTHMPCVRTLVQREMKLLGARRKVLQEIESWQQTGLPIDPMESVSQGAALKASKIIEEIGTTLSEGYGTILGKDYYEKIIPQDAPCPINKKCTVTLLTNSLVLRVPLVCKLADPASSVEETISKFEMLGYFSIAIPPSKDWPSVTVVVDIKRDKTVTVTLIHHESGQQVVYQALNELEGKECPWVQDTDPPDGVIPPPFPGSPSYTAQQLEALLHAAVAVRQMIPTKVRGACPNDIEALLQRLGSLVQRAASRAQPSSLDINTDCPNILNSIKSLLWMMCSKQLISQQEYDDGMAHLRTICP